MNIKLLGLFVLGVLFISLGCKPQQNNIEDVSIKFFDYVKKGDYNGAKSLCAQHFRQGNSVNDNSSLEQIHDALDVHNIPPKDKWRVKYDTIGIFKTKTYTIEIYRNDSSKRPKSGLAVDLSFDYTRNYTGDSIIFFNPHPIWDYA